MPVMLREGHATGDAASAAQSVTPGRHARLSIPAICPIKALCLTQIYSGSPVLCQTQKEPVMNADFFPSLRTRVGALLEQPTTELDPQNLYKLVRDHIDQERSKHRAAGGCGSILTLNDLLDIEMQLRTKVFGQPRDAIQAAF
jgi:hypothetical protein